MPSPEPIGQLFFEKFGSEPVVVRSPGRVNIIGEHTDYNQGFVLPAAIDRFANVAVQRRDDDVIQLYSREFNETYQTHVSSIEPVKGWPTYALGVVDQLKKAGYQPAGFNLVLSGDVPIGAGLSSSAAVECATLFALAHLNNYAIPRMEMAGLTQQAEISFAGVRCGIMDQFASLFGKKDFAVRLDCRSLAYEYIPLNLAGYKIVLFNTNVKHSLASSAYNKRREECEQGVAWIAERIPGITSLRDVTAGMLRDIVLPKDETIYKRCHYVVQENARLLDACAAMEQGNIALLGERMFQSHEGLSLHYEVSCHELDTLVDLVKHDPDVAGARMMGGGFGGCTINLVKEKAVELLTHRLSKQYKDACGLDLSVYIANTADGTQLVTEE